ncbi:MAG TPA: multicopper oxidase family protein [Bryobacteraceae bacterium]|nr:multicopper oxidase family protein [Bryobacteraceae bacterium]
MTTVGRRQFLSTLGLAATALGAQEPARPDYSLKIGSATVEPRPGKAFKTIGYNGSVPGPLIRVKEGATVTIGVLNESPLPELVHWHGLRAPSEVDGSMEEGTPMLMPGKSATYSFTASPAGTRWYHSHGMAGTHLDRATYSGQYGFFVIDAAQDAGGYDREIFLSLKEWDAYLSMMGDEDGFMEVAYKYATINGKSLGHGDPIPVKPGERVLLRILNASATMHRRIAMAGHTFLVTAMDGNRLAAPKESPVLEMGPAERIDAIVEMKNPGVWIFGSTDDKERDDGLGIVFEYAGASGAPKWIPASNMVWNYALFGNAGVEAGQGERLPIVFENRFLGRRQPDHWMVNGKAWPKTDPLRVKAGGRYRLVFDNRADEAHPVHLHRHTFELAKIAGVPTSGVFKDVVVVPAMTQMEALLIADNPGKTLFHCHHQMHMDEGFMALMEYV